MNNLVVSDLTKGQLEAFIKHPAHALLLTGNVGVGKLILATSVAAALLKTDRINLNKSAYFKHTRPIDGKAIGIEEARLISNFLNLKVPSSQSVNRVVLIEDGHLLTGEAQNALLKTLEEPPLGTVLIVTTSDDHALLPTIRSRSQQIAIQRPSKDKIKTYFTGLGYTSDAIDRAYAMSGGLPGLMQAILSDGQHPLLSAASKARQLLGLTAFQRLTMVDELVRDRQLLEQIVNMFSIMAEISLQTANGAAAQHWQRILKYSYQASQQLKAKAQPKLVIDELLLNI